MTNALQEDVLGKRNSETGSCTTQISTRILWHSDKIYWRSFAFRVIDRGLWNKSELSKCDRFSNSSVRRDFLRKQFKRLESGQKIMTFLLHGTINEKSSWVL